MVPPFGQIRGTIYIKWYLGLIILVVPFEFKPPSPAAKARTSSRKRPESKAKVESAAGCGVFANVGSRVLLPATVHGYGIGRGTYMRMVELGGGLGLGVKKS